MSKKIPDPLLQVVIEYLARQPYAEVHQLIGALLQLEPVPVETVLAKEAEA